MQNYNFFRNATIFCGVALTFYLTLEVGEIGTLIGIIAGGFGYYKVHELTLRMERSLTLRQYAQEKLPIFIEQQSPEDDEVLHRYQQTVAFLKESQNTVLSDADVHKIYFQDVRYDPLENWEQYQARIEAYKVATIKDWQKKVLSKTNFEEWSEKHLYGQNMGEAAPPDTIFQFQQFRALRTDVRAALAGKGVTHG